MVELYKKLEKYRDKHRDSNNYNKYIKPILNQLLVIGFNNESNPNKLPIEFTIENVHFEKNEFEALMLDIGYKVNATMKFREYDARLYTYEVHICYSL